MNKIYTAAITIATVLVFSVLTVNANEGKWQVFPVSDTFDFYSSIVDQEKRIRHLEKQLLGIERPMYDSNVVNISEIVQSYWTVPSPYYLLTSYNPDSMYGPGKFAVQPGQYTYVCTKAYPQDDWGSHILWHRIVVPDAPNGWVWVRMGFGFLNYIYC